MEVKFFYILIIRTCLKTFETFGNPSLVSNASWLIVMQWRTRHRKNFSLYFLTFEVLFEIEKSKPEKMGSKLKERLSHPKVTKIIH